MGVTDLQIIRGHLDEIHWPDHGERTAVIDGRNDISVYRQKLV
jgi:hypothetical protein